MTDRCSRRPRCSSRGQAGAGAIVSTIGDLAAGMARLPVENHQPRRFRRHVDAARLADGKLTDYGRGLGSLALKVTDRIGHGGGTNGSLTGNSTYPDDNSISSSWENSLRGDPGAR